jgi:preprotein translocase subunit SecG
LNAQCVRKNESSFAYISYFEFTQYEAGLVEVSSSFGRGNRGLKSGEGCYNMLQRITIISAVLIFAFGILFTSVLRSASVKYGFGDSKQGTFTNVLGDEDVNIDYTLPYPGKILPDSPLWRLKALRDRVWLLLTTNQSKKVELELLFADKRLGSSAMLFEKGKSELAYSTLTKAEKYLEEASQLEETVRKGGSDTSDINDSLSKAALKHYEVMQELFSGAPEEEKPGIVVLQNIPKSVFERARNALLEKGRTPVENPFDWR